MILLSPINWPCFYWNNKGSLRKNQVLVKNIYKYLTLRVFRVQMIMLWCYSTRNELCYCMNKPQALIVVAVSILQGAPLCVSVGGLWQVCRTLIQEEYQYSAGCPQPGTWIYAPRGRIFIVRAQGFIVRTKMSLRWSEGCINDLIVFILTNGGHKYEGTRIEVPPVDSLASKMGRSDLNKLENWATVL